MDAAAEYRAARGRVAGLVAGLVARRPEDPLIGSVTSLGE